MEHTKIDFWGTVEAFQKEGHSAYELILAASRRARDISNTRNIRDMQNGRLNKYPMKPINTALKEFETEVNNKESE